MVHSSGPLAQLRDDASVSRNRVISTRKDKPRVEDRLKCIVYVVPKLAQDS